MPDNLRTDHARAAAQQSTVVCAASIVIAFVRVAVDITPLATPYLPLPAGASATWLSAVHCAGSTSQQQQVLRQLLQLHHPAPPSALLTALLCGKQAAAAAGRSAGLQGAVMAGAGQVMPAARDAAVVGWLRAVMAAADWCCWALDQG